MPGWNYIVFVLNLAWLYLVCPDIMNIIIKYKCGMTVCDEMYMYDILVKQGFPVSAQRGPTILCICYLAASDV